MTVRVPPCSVATEHGKRDRSLRHSIAWTIPGNQIPFRFLAVAPCRLLAAQPQCAILTYYLLQYRVSLKFYKLFVAYS